MLVIHESCGWEPLFTRNQSVPSSVSLQDHLVVRVQLFVRPQQAGNDDLELAQAIPTANAIVININHFQNDYDTLIDEFYSRFVKLSKDLLAFSQCSENHFWSTIMKCQIVGSEIWTIISELQHNPSGKEQALDI
jgi:hypothetical protein